MRCRVYLDPKEGSGCVVFMPGDGGRGPDPMIFRKDQTVIEVGEIWKPDAEVPELLSSFLIGVPMWFALLEVEANEHLTYHVVQGTSCSKECDFRPSQALIEAG